MKLEEVLNANDYISNWQNWAWMYGSKPPYCCESGDDERDERNRLYKDWVESNVIKKETIMPKVVEFKEEKNNDEHQHV